MQHRPALPSQILGRRWLSGTSDKGDQKSGALTRLFQNVPAFAAMQ